MKQHISDAQRQAFAELVDEALYRLFRRKGREMLTRFQGIDKGIADEYLLDDLGKHDGLYDLMERAKARGLDASLHVLWEVIPDSEVSKARDAKYAVLIDEANTLLERRSNFIARVWTADTTSELKSILDQAQEAA